MRAYDVHKFSCGGSVPFWVDGRNSSLAVPIARMLNDAFPDPLDTAFAYVDIVFSSEISYLFASLSDFGLWWCRPHAC